MKNGFLELDQELTRALPGATITGVARWTSDEKLERVAVRAFWSTQGKGTCDQGDGDVKEFERPRNTDEQRFELRLPEGPYSFEGRLISLAWQIELALDDEPIAAIDMVLSPFEKPIVLLEVEDDKPGSITFLRRK